jgi:hypothetical protein
MDYTTEYLDENDKVVVAHFSRDLAKARNRARYLSRRDNNLLVYVVADNGSERVGAEAYAYGRRDSADGQMS